MADDLDSIVVIVQQPLGNAEQPDVNSTRCPKCRIGYLNIIGLDSPCDCCCWICWSILCCIALDEVRCDYCGHNVKLDQLTNNT